MDFPRHQIDTKGFYVMAASPETASHCETTVPGATMISFFFDRTRRNVRSFCGSMSRTQLRACAARPCRRPAYCTLVELSSVVRTGIPAKQLQHLGQTVSKQEAMLSLGEPIVLHYCRLSRN